MTADRLRLPRLASFSTSDRILSLRIPLLQQRIECARGLAVAALGPAGLRRLRPGVDVEVDPGFRRRDEAAQEQRRRDRAALVARGDVVDIGGLGFEQALVGPPQ